MHHPLTRCLRLFFSAPVLGNEDETRRARLLSGYVNMILVAMPLVAVSIPFAPIPQGPSYWVIAVTTFAAIGLRVMLHRGKIDPVAWLIVALGLLATTAALASRGSILSAGSSGYLLIVVMAGLLLGMKGMLAALGTSTVALISIYALESSGAFPVETTGATVVDAVTLCMLMAFAGINVAWALEKVTHSLHLARKEAEERRQAEESLRREIQRREKAEEQLRQAQKMEAVGRLAGGVAHDFNNLLTVIIGLGDMILMKPELDQKTRSDLEQMRSAAEQAAGVTQQLLAFSRKQVLQARVVNVNEVLTEIEGMLKRLLGEDVLLETSLFPGLKNVFADQSQLQQVVMNLAVNARDAMPDGGKLFIETANVFLDEAQAQYHPDVIPGEYVQLVISDTGMGMDEELQSIAFDPFVTTKDLGKGTGLGLATVHGIVTQSGGSLDLSSKLGQGTTFRLLFPVKEGEPPAIPEPTIVSERANTGNETILLVEDEERIIGLAYRILTQSGYRVIKARQAEEAIEMCRNIDEDPDLLVTDVILPGRMSGRDLAKQLSDMIPSLRILFISGYTGSAIVRHGVLDDGVNFLPKPFTVESLNRKVREVLDG
jgi:signal transduction histidine kinase